MTGRDAFLIFRIVCKRILPALIFILLKQGVMSDDGGGVGSCKVPIHVSVRDLREGRTRYGSRDVVGLLGSIIVTNDVTPVSRRKLSRSKWPGEQRHLKARLHITSVSCRKESSPPPYKEKK